MTSNIVAILVVVVVVVKVHAGECALEGRRIWHFGRSKD